MTIHPFDDGNGRIARALTDMQLSKADGLNQPIYSMSAQIKQKRKDYYTILEKSQKGDSDTNNGVVWILNCLKVAIVVSTPIIDKVVRKQHFWKQNNVNISNDRQRMMLNKLMDTALRDITDLVNIRYSNKS